MKYITTNHILLILAASILILSFSKLERSTSDSTHFELKTEVISSDTGMIILTFIKDYAHVKLNHDTIFSLNKDKIFRGEIPYPHLARIIFKNKKNSYMTDPFFVEPGKQKIIIRVSNSGEITYTLNGSRTQSEYLLKYKPFLETINNKRDEWYSNIPILRQSKTWDSITTRDSMMALLQDIISKEDSLNVKYTRRYPGSYVGFWLLIDKFNKRSYKQIYEKGFDYLDDNLKMNLTGKEFNKALNNASSLAIGNVLPLMKLKDIEGDIQRVRYKNHKYTIIDFWYSRCGPCIEDFRTIKAFYHSLKEKRVQLIAVSTDKSSDVGYWKKKVGSENYPWEQLLDENGEWANRHSINAFPYNIIIDSIGEICYKNLSPVEIKSTFLGD